MININSGSINKYFKEGSTLSSFLSLFKDEVSGDRQVAAICEFGHMTLELSEKLKGREDLEEPVQWLVNTALNILSELFRSRIHMTDNDILREKILVEIGDYQMQLRELRSKLDTNVYLEKLDEKVNILKGVFEQGGPTGAGPPCLEVR